MHGSPQSRCQDRHRLADASLPVATRQSSGHCASYRYAESVASERITVDPNKSRGVPIIRDLRMPVATVVTMVAEGKTVDENLSDFPDRETEDIRAALHFTVEAVLEPTLSLSPSP